MSRGARRQRLDALPPPAAEERSGYLGWRVLSRRSLIKGGLGIAGLAVAAPLLGACSSRDERGSRSGPDQRILIVGAGAAGLAAAGELQARGFENVVILEASDRVGGRIRTGSLGDGVPVELGATWIHGIRGNPVHDIARRHGIATAETDYDNEVRYDDSGRELAPISGRRWRDYMESAYDLPDETLLEVFERFAASNGFDAAERRNWRHALNSMFEQEFGADLADLSILSYDGGGELGGGDVVFPGGYSQIVDVLSQGRDIRIDEAVEMIDYSGSTVRVTTQSGGAFEADRVIVTVPLGVLKAGLVAFEPALPGRVLQAIDSLEMGVLNRTCLLFDEVFWKPDVEWIQIVDDTPGQWSETLNLYPYLHEPALAIFNAGSYGASVEQYSDDELTRLAVDTLASVFGDVPQPVDSLSTRWTSDPWTRGSYSYVPAGESFRSYTELARPVGERLFLAGEATHDRYPSTVHGALLSGRRAARQIAEAT
ncbi:MAG: FAD-dependent oxidoreductase [bacterium]|nr:FAD-dependent oxidoreductase [bacterium]